MQPDLPSEFWRQLADQHTRDLSAFGFERIKRKQAFKYFNWDWRWRNLTRSEQFRFLLRHSGISTLVRCAAAGTALDDASWMPIRQSRADRWLYSFATRLLWEYAIRHGDRDVLALAEPDLGSPLPVSWQGRLISQDLANTSLETAVIRRALGDKPVTRVLEVGAGYGRTAHALLNVYPACSYTIIDIEPALSISKWYLSQLFPASRLTFILANGASPIETGSYDLALSISSLQEMTPPQVAGYLSLFNTAAAGGTVFLKQWTRWHNSVDRVTATFDDYPVPGRWRRVLHEQAPVQTRFTQAAWRVPV